VATKTTNVNIRMTEDEYGVLTAIKLLIESQHEGLEVNSAQIVRKVLNESKNRYKENFKQWEGVYNNASDEDKAILSVLLK
jgi:predicted RNA binding protein with dsRBD fold (UPF0201 family)